MEFQRCNPERRQDRRICPACHKRVSTRSGAQTTCPRCGQKTVPRIRLVWTIHGKRHRQLTNCWRERDAREILQGIESDYWRQQRPGISRDVAGSIAAAVAAFEQSRANQSPHWLLQIRTALYPLRDGMGGDPDAVDIRSVTRDDLGQYLPES